MIDYYFSKRLQTRLLTEKNLIFEKTLEVAAAIKVSKRQEELMSKSPGEQSCAVLQSCCVIEHFRL